MSLTCGFEKYNKLVNITRKKQTHRYREPTCSYQRGEGRGGAIWGPKSNGYKLLGRKYATKTYYTTL